MHQLRNNNNKTWSMNSVEVDETRNVDLAIFIVSPSKVSPAYSYTNCAIYAEVVYNTYFVCLVGETNVIMVVFTVWKIDLLFVLRKSTFAESPLKFLK